jgi:hypothetical protein
MRTDGRTGRERCALAILGNVPEMYYSASRLLASCDPCEQSINLGSRCERQNSSSGRPLTPTATRTSQALHICRICPILDITAFILFATTSLSPCSSYVADPSLSDFLDAVVHHTSRWKQCALLCEEWTACRKVRNGNSAYPRLWSRNPQHIFIISLARRTLVHAVIYHACILYHLD